MKTIRRLGTGGLAAIVATGLVAGLGAGAGAADEITVVNTGGNLMNTFRTHFFDAFTEATGTEVVSVPATTGEQFARVRAMEQIDRIEWDVVTTTVTNFISEADLLEPLDCGRLENLDQAVEGACTEFGILRNIAVTIIASSKEAFPDGGPKTWPEFWDVEKFPGPRCMEATLPSVVMAIALEADGVAREDLYPLDIDRAIASLEKIKPHTSVWWTTGDQSQQTLRNGECVASMMWSGQIIPMVRNGEPFDFSWDGGVHVTGYWSILKDAPNKEGAYKFLDFFLGRPEAHKGLYEMTFYDPPNRHAFDGESDEDMRMHVSHPDTYALTVPEDWKALGPQMDEIRRRFTAFLAL